MVPHHLGAQPDMGSDTMRRPPLALLLLVSTLAFCTSSMMYSNRHSSGSGIALAAIPNVAAGSVLASKGSSTGPAMQTKPIIDVRDITGVDCTGTTDSSTALNSFFANLSGLTVMFPPGVPCKLRANNQIVIQGQSGFEITGWGGTPYALGPQIFGCGTSNTGAVVYINRSSLWKLEGFDIEAKGNSCTSTFTQSLQVDNTGSGGYTATDTDIERMSFSSNWGGGTIFNYIGINHTSQPNGESFRVRDSLINCQNSSASYGVRLAGANQDNGELHHNSISYCFQGIRLEGGNPRIENNQFGNDGAYSVFGANGAAIFVSSCASPPMTIERNEESDGGPFINTNNDASGGSCSLMNIRDNIIGISDISSSAYPVNIGTSDGNYLFEGNNVYITGSTTKSVIGSSSQTNCTFGPLGSLVDIENYNAYPANSGGWSGCAGGPDFQQGHLQLGYSGYSTETNIAGPTGGGLIFDDVKETATPANPNSGYERWYANSTTHVLSCLTSSGGNCAPSSTGGSLPSASTLGQAPISTGSGTTYAAQSKPFIEVRDYGAVPDGSTNNATAIAAAFAASNAVTTGIPTVYFGCNGAGTTCEYNYGGTGISPINPTIPTSIECAQGVVLNYTGSAHAVDLGPTGLTYAKIPVERYTVEGCTFTGGASYTEGIFINNFLINVLIHKNQFFNFGNTTGANINYTGNNWEMVIDDNLFNSKDATGPRNVIDGHLAANSTIHFTDNIISCLSAAGLACGVSGQGYGIWTAPSAYIVNNEIKFHQPLIRISSCTTCGSGTGFYVAYNVLEGNSGESAPAITYGDPGTVGTAVYTDNGVIANNTWYWPAGTGGIPYVGPEKASSGSFTLNGTIFEHNLIGGNSNSPPEYVNTNGGAGNRNSNNQGGSSGGELTQFYSFFDADSKNSENVSWYQPTYGSAWYLQSPLSTPSSNTDFAIAAAAENTVINASAGSSGIRFSINANNYWAINGSSPTGDLIAVTDNANNIGALGAHRPANIWAGTAIISPEFCIGASCITSWPSSNSPTGESGLVRAENVCRITSAVPLSSAFPTTICSWSLPAVAKIWFWQCSGTYTLASGTNPTFGLGMNASQTPTSETGNGIIWSAASVQTFGSSTATASGNKSIMTGVTNTTVNAPWQSSGTIQASATAGTFAITGTLGGTGTPAGRVNIGSGCTLQ